MGAIKITNTQNTAKNDNDNKNKGRGANDVRYNKERDSARKNSTQENYSLYKTIHKIREQEEVETSSCTTESSTTDDLSSSDKVSMSGNIFYVMNKII